jgi:hypothetical protein
VSETTEVIFNVIGVTDIGFGDSTSTFTQVDRLQVDGTTADQTAQYIDSAVIPLSSAAKTLLSLTGTKDLDDGFTALASSVGVATTSTLGTVRISTAAAVPVALITADPVYGYIPTSAQKDGLTGTPAEYTISGYTAPSTTNGYMTEGQTDASLYGTGRDGVFKVGVVAANSTVSALAEVTSAGVIPAGTYNYKVTAGNASGETNVSAASSNIVLSGSTSAVTLTVPVNGDTDCAWRKIYRSDNTGAGTYRLIGYIPDNTTTTFRDTLAYGGTAAPSSDTTSASLTLPAGEYHFVGDVTLPTTTLSGDAVIRCTGTFSNSATVTGSGSGHGRSRLSPMGPDGTIGQLIWLGAEPRGFGTNFRALAMPSAGSAGMTSGGTAGTGGLPGASLIVYCYKARIGAAITSSGATGAAGSGGNSGGGGGGAGALIAIMAREVITSATATVTTSGGTGGAGAGTGRGGRAGGGGCLFLRAPSVDTTGLTHTKAAGTDGADGGTAYAGGQGGTCSGDGGNLMCDPGAGTVIRTDGRVATAGQTITSLGHPFELGVLS